MLCVQYAAICFGLSSTYVASFYVWNNPLSRNKPSTIKKRFISVFFMSIISAIVVYYFRDEKYFRDYSYWSLIGLRYEGILQAGLLPLFLTTVLYSGPLCVHYIEGMHQKVFDFRLWKHCICDVVWLRNHIVAPFSEEFTFRACMLPLLVPCFGTQSIFICPLFFGIAHLHHLPEKLARGMNIKIALLESLFQLSYTTIFGAYSSYLFLKTGHFMAPLVVHSFCNHMGFPELGELLNYEQPKKTFLMIVFAWGLIAWMMLLNVVANPVLYHNTLYSVT